MPVPPASPEQYRRDAHLNVIRALEQYVALGHSLTVTENPPPGVYDSHVPLDEQERIITLRVQAAEYDTLRARLGGGG
jgi:hypothetical protein